VNAPNLEKRAERALLATLNAVPFVKAKLVTRQRIGTIRTTEIDTIIEAKLPRGKRLLVCEFKSSGEPRFARMVANQLSLLLPSLPDAYGVFLAPYISPRSAGLCRQAGIGYADLAGNCLLSFDGVYILREGNKNPFAKRRDLRTLYSPKAERVLRVLLADPSKAWTMRPLAAEAGVAVSQASRVKKLLDDREWTETARSGFSLADPESMLAEWSENYAVQRNARLGFYTAAPLGEVEAGICEACESEGIRCALAEFSAGARYAPAVRYRRASAYVGDSVEMIADKLSLKEVPSGANVTLLEPYDGGVFYGAESIDGAPVVSPLQAYLDLLASPARGKEAADALLERTIRPRWRRDRNT
jgi:hypothetical protein